MKKLGRPVGSFTGKYPTKLNGKITKAYTVYTAMKQRCYNPNAENYKYYGARGITVCDRWLGPQGFHNFVDDMGQPPPGMWLDKISNEKPYSPENCRWVTTKESGQNRTQGGLKNRDENSLRGKARAAGLPYMLVYSRIRLGWSEEKSLTTPKLPKGRQVGWKKPSPVPEYPCMALGLAQRHL